MEVFVQVAESNLVGDGDEAKVDRDGWVVVVWGSW